MSYQPNYLPAQPLSRQCSFYPTNRRPSQLLAKPAERGPIDLALTSNPQNSTNVTTYISAILGNHEPSLNVARLKCTNDFGDHYNYLNPALGSPSSSVDARPRYLFALDLKQCVTLLPTLLGAILESIQILGPHNCALSIVEGLSDDGTKEVLQEFHQRLLSNGLASFLQNSDIDSLDGGDRIKHLAKLRNLALKPYIDEPKRWSDSSIIIFINDVALCTDDILELIHQQKYLGADMVCPMDWDVPDNHNNPTFYDVWVARDMTGETFFQIAESSGWDWSQNLFWNDPESKQKYNNNNAFQVYSCWNGMTAFAAAPILDQSIHFRNAQENECFQGEPQLFAKDLWHLGFRKIAFIPTINLAYSDENSQHVKNTTGYVNQLRDGVNDRHRIVWTYKTPQQVRCIPSFDDHFLAPWDQGYPGSEPLSD